MIRIRTLCENTIENIRNTKLHILYIVFIYHVIFHLLLQPILTQFFYKTKHFYTFHPQIKLQKQEGKLYCLSFFFLTNILQRVALSQILKVLRTFCMTQIPWIFLWRNICMSMYRTYTSPATQLDSISHSLLPLRIRNVPPSPQRSFHELTHIQ